MKDSIVYLIILDYVKKNGIDEFKKLFAEVERLNSDYNTLKVNDYIIKNEKAKKLDSVINKNVKIVEFLRKISNNRINFLNSNFKKFILNLDSIDKIDLYLNNAKKLSLLGIDEINLDADLEEKFDTEFHFDCNEKFKEALPLCVSPNFAKTIYTDGKISLYESYNNDLVNYGITKGKDVSFVYFTYVNGANFILAKTKDKENKLYTSFNQKGFGFDFDGNKLPSIKDLDNKEEPDYVQEYKENRAKLYRMKIGPYECQRHKSAR